MSRPLSGKRPKAAVPVDLNDVVALVRVVEAGSFTGAASQMGLPKSAVSRVSGAPRAQAADDA